MTQAHNSGLLIHDSRREHFLKRPFHFLRKKDTRKVQRKGSLYDLLASVKLTFILFAILALIITLGTIFPQGGTAEEYIQAWGKGRYERYNAWGLLDIYHTPLFLGLGLLLLLNLILCTIERIGKRRWSFSSIFFHVAIVVCFVGFFQSYLGAFEDSVLIYPGKPVKVEIFRTNTRAAVLADFQWWKYKPFQFLAPEPQEPLAISLNRFETEYVWSQGVTFKKDLKGKVGLTMAPLTYDTNQDPYYPKSWKSEITITQKGKTIAQKAIQVNSPIKIKGLTFYQSHYEQKFDLQFQGPGEKPGRVAVKLGEPFSIEGIPGKLRVKAVRTGALYKKGSTPEAINPFADLYYLAPQDPQAPKDAPAPKPLVVAHLEPDKPAKYHEYTFIMKNFQEATGLSYRYDPGVKVLWVASILAMIGMVLKVYFKI